MEAAAAGRPRSQSAATFHAESSAIGTSRTATDKGKTVGLLVIGLLGALAFVGSSVLIFRTLSHQEDDAPAARDSPAVLQPAETPAPATKALEAENGADSTTTATTGEAGSTSDGGAASTDAATEEPVPDEPPRPRTKRNPRSRGGKLTDAKVRARLEQRLAACIDPGQGVKLTVDLVVGSDGGILNKRVKGAAGAVQTCALEVVRKAKFPTGAPRRFTLRASK